jgi:hypothetical protein
MAQAIGSGLKFDSSTPRRCPPRIPNELVIEAALVSSRLLLTEAVHFAVSARAAISAPDHRVNARYRGFRNVSP